MIGFLLLKKIASMFLIVFAGWLLVKTGVVKTEDSKVISVIGLYLVTPCMVLSAFHIDLTEEVKSGFFLALGASLIIYVVAIVVSALFGKIAKLESVEKASIVYTNSGNLIIPIVMSLFGKEWVIYTTGYNILFNIFFWTHGRQIISGEKKIEWKKIVANPNFVSIFIGLIMLFSGVRLPALVMEAVDSVGAMVGPISMIITGMLIAGMDRKKIIGYKRIWIPTVLRLIVVPLIVIAVFKVTRIASLSANGETVVMISFLAGASAAATSIVHMAQAFGSDHAADYSAAISIVTTLLCILTMPLMATLMEIL